MVDLTGWIGKTAIETDLIDTRPAAAFCATIDTDMPPPALGECLPSFWHWLYFHQMAPRSELGRDGHPQKGWGMTPPVPLPRRMWAGGRLKFPGQLIMGEIVERRSEIIRITEKNGRSGPLCFTTLRHSFTGSKDKGEAVIEEQDIVYRNDHDRNMPAPILPAPPQNSLWQRQMQMDSTALFRYSALTFNGHRIHYDREYARDIEGYPGLVVHGPLLATLMLDLWRQEGNGQQIAEFNFRAISPIFDFERFTLCGCPTDSGADLWVTGPEERLAMQGNITLQEYPLSPC